MQIRVKCTCGESECSEWVIVELQGVIEPQAAYQDRLQNLEIGKLCRPSEQETYTFTIGYHELTGSKVPLKKPMVVLKKVKLGGEDSNGNPSLSKVELEVIGIIRHRILFKSRPKALISSKLQLFLAQTQYNVYKSNMESDSGGKPRGSPQQLKNSGTVRRTRERQLVKLASCACRFRNPFIGYYHQVETMLLVPEMNPYGSIYHSAELNNDIGFLYLIAINQEKAKSEQVVSATSRRFTTNQI
ncbi:uncharacterized protein LOC124925179 [Impatiens glandulifera]|uniref:uncharacterized protein LOC124925179 n=1 Tax=Impatiens glandulifera TaxID=253017 RepID=UPI001FB16CBE|nr:uncharacterized protein LOC124925179 [Impatiens glandulifera]